MSGNGISPHFGMGNGTSADEARSGSLLPGWVPWIGGGATGTEDADDVKTEKPGLVERAKEAASDTARSVFINQLPGAKTLFNHDPTSGFSLTGKGWLVVAGAGAAFLLMRGR